MPLQDYFYHDNMGPGAVRPNATANGTLPGCSMHWRPASGCTDKSVPGVKVLGFQTVQTNAECCVACGALVGCGAWTFRPIGAKNCLLANRATPPRAGSPGMSCGSVNPLPPPSGCYYRDFWDSENSGPATDPTFFPRYSTYLFAEKAVGIIYAHDVSQGPLFLYIAAQSAHSPLEVPEEYLAMYKSYALCAQYRRGSDYTCTGPPLAEAGYCPCQRMVISAMVTALDDLVANVTRALESRAMYNDTVLVLSGDNGGPEMLAHWNGGLRGGKWTHFNGGILPAAFVWSPLLPLSARGSWYNGTMHLVDWAQTFVGLAGLPLVPGIDGVDQWAAISGTNASAQPMSPRNETLITTGVVIVGKYKLSVVPLAGFGECGATGRQGWDCLLGTGGGWLPELRSGLVGNNTNQCPNIACANAAPGVDAWLCSGQCSLDLPCLYDLDNDPAERINLATTQPSLLAQLLPVLYRLNSTVVPPYAPLPGASGDAQCSAYHSRWTRGGIAYFGPWI